MQQTTEKALIAYITMEQTRFYRLAFSYLKNQEDALDAVQTAVCRSLEKRDSLRNPEALRPWFYHILVNACLDLLRQRNKTVPFPEGMDLEDPGQEDPALADDSLAQRVEALPAEIGTVIRLRFYEELSLKEISAVTGVNLSTVKSRLYAGLKKLRIAMEGAEDE